MRILSSCSTCRSRKKKCISRAGADVCQLCEIKGLQCDIANVRTRIGPCINPRIRPAPVISLPSPESLVSTPPVSEAPGIVAGTLQDRGLCNELVEAYFELVHEKQHIIFHRPSLIAQQQAGMVPDYLLLGIIALVARSAFAGTSPWVRGLPFLQEGIRAYNSRPRLVCIEALQGAVLLGFAAAVEGDGDQEALFCCQAVRMVQLLRLPLKLSPDSLRKQLEIRLFWQCWMMDTWNSVRCQVPIQLRNDPRLPKPIEEQLFNNMRGGHPSGAENNEASHAPSIWAAIIPLTHYHAQVVQLNHDLVHEPALDFRVRNSVQELSMKLDRWRTSLPDHMRETPFNLASYESRGYGQVFANMHIIYHHTSQSLYYQFLNRWTTEDSTQPIDEEAVMYAGRCKAHATALSKLMWTLHTDLKRECLWSPVNGHLLVIASSIHLHTLLLDPSDAQVSDAKELLEQNFVMLQRLQECFRYAESSVSRLRAFHRACERMGTPGTFDMDKWMVRFLNRYDMAVGDRDGSFEGDEGVVLPEEG